MCKLPSLPPMNRVEVEQKMTHDARSEGLFFMSGYVWAEMTANIIASFFKTFLAKWGKACKEKWLF